MVAAVTAAVQALDPPAFTADISKSYDVLSEMPVIVVEVPTMPDTTVQVFAPARDHRTEYVATAPPDAGAVHVSGMVVPVAAPAASAVGRPGSANTVVAFAVAERGAVAHDVYRQHLEP